MEEKIAHKEAFIESSKKTRQNLLNSNGFKSEKAVEEYQNLNLQLEELSEQLDERILNEQNNFDLIYDRIDAIKDVAEVVLDHRDIEELKASLRKEFSKDFSDADIEKAEKQFNDYDNGNRSTHRRLKKNKRDIEKGKVRKKDIGISAEKGKIDKCSERGL